MSCLTLNISKTNLEDLSSMPDKYPETNTGTFVIERKLNEPNYMLYEVDHGTPNSDTLRNIETGEVTIKDINEIDSKFGYIVIDKRSNYILSSTGISIREFEKVLAVILRNTDIKIEPFYSQRQVIETMQYLSEITFYTKPEASMFGLEEELVTAIKNSKMIDASNDSIKEISLSIKFDNMPLNSVSRAKITSYLNNAAFKNVSVKTHDDNFTNIINTNSISTKIKLDNQTIENGKLNLEEFKKEFSKIDITSLIGESHV